MAATIEVNYFNSFWIKKIDSIVEVKPSVSEIATTADSSTQEISSVNRFLGYGQRVFC